LGSSWYGRKIILKMIDNNVDKRISLSKAIERLKSTQYSVKFFYQLRQFIYIQTSLFAYLELLFYTGIRKVYRIEKSVRRS